MKFAFLVALREYAENAKTTGFWLGILLVPVIIFFSIQVPIWLETKGTPTRHFVLVDQSGTLASVIESRVERLHQRQVDPRVESTCRHQGTSAEREQQPRRQAPTNAGVRRVLRS